MRARWVDLERARGVELGLLDGILLGRLVSMIFVVELAVLKAQEGREEGREGREVEESWVFLKVEGESRSRSRWARS